MRVLDANAMANTAPIPDAVPIISLAVDRETWGLVFEANLVVVGLGALVAALGIYLFRASLNRKIATLDLDETELGVGSAKITLRPNYTDRQVAYQVWVELSTRKIGLEIDLDYDVNL